MSFDADAMIDRRSLRRKLTFWRVLAIVAALVLIVGLGLAYGARNFGTQTSHIARVAVTGLITGDQATLDTIRRAKTTKNAVAALVTINSPGGTTTGSEAVYDEIRELAKVKPTVAIVTGTAASGAYIAALGTDRIYALETGIVGSIGVILQYPNFSKLLDSVGVKVEAVRSTPLKALPSGIEPTPPEAREAIAATVLDTYDWFKNLVKTRRQLSDEELTKVVDGRVFTGRQGMPLKLVDQLGGEREALAWLEQEKKIDKSLRVVEYRRQTSLNRFGMLSVIAGAASILGYEDAASVLSAAQRQADVHSLDGLLAVWQPR